MSVYKRSDAAWSSWILSCLEHVEVARGGGIPASDGHIFPIRHRESGTPVTGWSDSPSASLASDGGISLAFAEPTRFSFLI